MTFFFQPHHPPTSTPHDVCLGVKALKWVPICLNASIPLGSAHRENATVHRVVNRADLLVQRSGGRTLRFRAWPQNFPHHLVRPQNPLSISHPLVAQATACEGTKCCRIPAIFARECVPNNPF